MNRTTRLYAPVISIISPSFTASKKAVSLLSVIGNMEQFSIVTDDALSSQNSLNETFKSSFPGLSCSWTSVGARCPVSGAVIHFCSIGDLAEKGRETKTKPFALLGITESDEPSSDSASAVEMSIRNFRNLLASRLRERTALNRSLLHLKRLINGSLTTKDLLRDISHDGLPLLTVPQIPRGIDACVTPRGDLKGSEDLPSTFLKEIVVPHFDYAAYRDGSNLVSHLGLAPTKPPAVGVYQWPNSTMLIRPLPTASEDAILPSPSLIFHHQSPEDISWIREKTSKGKEAGRLSRKGRPGVDVRYCPRTEVSSAFSEAQDSLLAGSLEELQSTNVLASTREGESDVRIGNGDCWVEVRANLRRPSKLLRRSKSSQGKQRIAKIPDIPYE
eukprot:jgi/Psemu1/321182/estExt_fgenesh1_pm.C_15560003